MVLHLCWAGDGQSGVCGTYECIAPSAVTIVFLMKSLLSFSGTSPGITGVWKILLDPMHAGGPFRVTAEQKIAAAVDIITLEDVYFGDVWLCGGQSNMELTVLQVIFLL